MAHILLYSVVFLSYIFFATNVIKKLDAFEDSFTNVFGRLVVKKEDVKELKKYCSKVYSCHPGQINKIEQILKDEELPVRKSHENKQIQELYKNFLGEPNSEKAHHLLHTTYTKRELYK